MSALAVTLTIEELEKLVERAVSRVGVAASKSTVPDVMTREHVGQLLHVHPNVVSTYVKKRGLPARRVGGEWRFLKSEVMAWILAQEAIKGAE